MLGIFRPIKVANKWLYHFEKRMGQMGTASTIFQYIKVSYWCRALTKNLYVANII